MRQSVREDQGIKQQRAACVAEVETRARQEPGQWEVVDEYPDNDTSATKARGEGTHWARLLGDIDAGRIDTIIVVSPDRLMRRLADVLEVRPPKRDVRIVTVRGGVDTADPSGFGAFMLGMFVLVAEQEIATKSIRAVPYREGRNAAGHPSPGRVPYGYRWRTEHERGKGGSRYAVVPQEAEAVRFMFREALAGSALGYIRRALNDGDARDAQGHKLGKSSRTTREGNAWHTSTIRRILISPVYAALLPPISPLKERRDATTGKVKTWTADRVDLDACHPGLWEPLVAEDVLRAVRGRLLDAGRRKQHDNARKWLLSGLAVCEVCGGDVRSAITKERYHGYRCIVGHFQRSGEVLDRYVEHVVLERLKLPDAARLIKPRPDIDLGALAAREGALRGARRELLDLAASGTFSAEEVRVRVMPMDDELARLTAQRAAALADDPMAQLVGADDIREAWEGLTLARRRRVIRELLVIVMRPVGKGRRVLTLEDAAATVALVWRKPSRPRVALPALVNEADVLTDADYADVRGLLVPDLSESQRAALAGALN
jgi:DNA invertase Pin-like site-specific DNA recombinase